MLYWERNKNLRNVGKIIIYPVINYSEYFRVPQLLLVISYPLRHAMCKGRLQGNRLTSAAEWRANNHLTRSILLAPTHFWRRLYPVSSCIVSMFSFYWHTQWLLNQIYIKCNYCLLSVFAVEDLQVSVHLLWGLLLKHQRWFEPFVW